MHGLFCEEITEPLRKIREFMDENPEEFIIFDCQHFYNFSDGDYGRLEKIFFEIFENKFFTSHDGPLNELTLYRANCLKRQLFVIYRYAHVPKEFWPSDCWPTPWPNQIKVKKLRAYLDTSLKYRSPDTGYVSQCVLTPPVGFIVPRYVFLLFCSFPRFNNIFSFYRFYSSLRKKCAFRVTKGLTDWIKVQCPGPFEFNGNQPTCNVFIADFIELNNFEFSRTVVELNSKILLELSFSACILTERSLCDKFTDEASDSDVDESDSKQ